MPLTKEWLADIIAHELFISGRCENVKFESNTSVIKVTTSTDADLEQVFVVEVHEYSSRRRNSN